MFGAWLCTQKMDSGLLLMLPTGIGRLSSVGKEYVARCSASLCHILPACVDIFNMPNMNTQTKASS